ncbi:MAG: phage holin, partial [Clostridiales bacterium]|nr:phage holin [Clostridiales bacterium]
MSENSRMTISAGTIARTIILVLALVNQILTAMGHSVINISDESINTLISTGFTIVTAVIAWWKN